MEIPCDVEGSPSPEVTWYRDTEPLSSIPAVRYNIADNGSLVINYMRREDSGMFQCSASNQAGYTTAYTWLRVKSKWIYCAVELETKAIRRFAKVSIVSYSRPSLMIIAFRTQFHVERPWGQRPFSIVS